MLLTRDNLIDIEPYQQNKLHTCAHAHACDLVVEFGAIADDETTPTNSLQSRATEAVIETQPQPPNEPLLEPAIVTNCNQAQPFLDQSDSSAAEPPFAAPQRPLSECEAQEVPPGPPGRPAVLGEPGIAQEPEVAPAEPEVAPAEPEASPAEPVAAAIEPKAAAATENAAPAPPSSRLADNVGLAVFPGLVGLVGLPVLAGLIDRLRKFGVQDHAITKITKQRTPAEIEQGLNDLTAQEGTIFHPAGWLCVRFLRDWEAVEAQKAAESLQLTEAGAARLKERREKPEAVPLSTLERDRLRAERLTREARDEQADRCKRDALLAQELAQGLGSLSPVDYAALRARAVASLGKRGATMVEGVIKGQMMSLLETDQLRGQTAGEQAPGRVLVE